MTHFNERSVAFVLLLSLAATAQTEPSVKAGRNEKNPARSPVMEAPSPEPVPIPSMSPEELPASAPNVTYIGGQLTIDANNATLVDILEEIRAKTGAVIEVPHDGSSERVAVHLSGSPGAIIPALLDGSTFGYVIRTSTEDPQGVREVILSRKPTSGTNPGKPISPTMSRRVMTRSFAASIPAPTPDDAPAEVADDTSNHTAAPPLQTVPALGEKSPMIAEPIAALDRSDESEENRAQTAQASPPAPVPLEDTHPAPPVQLTASQDPNQIQQQQETNRQFMQDLYRSRQNLQPQQQQAQQNQPPQ
jgi:hypothetical protein